MATEIEVPASTAWPLVLACGFTLLFAGLLTSLSVTVLGAVLSLVGCAGWFREVFPREHEVAAAVIVEKLEIKTARRVVERVPVAAEQLRVWLPLHTYPVSAGVKGGLAGSVAMAAVAGEERGRSRAVLQPGLPHVQVHPVDRLDLEDNMPGNDIGSRTR